MRILLVDDEELSRRALRVTIGRELPEVEIVGEACDGEEAVELVGRLEPDLTIMDIKMPELDGIEAARALRDNGTLSRLVFLTAYDEFDYARSAVDLQADAYLLKPVDKQELIRVIRRCADAIREEDARGRALLSTGERDRLREWAYRQTVQAVIDGDEARFAELADGIGLRFTAALLAVVRLPRTCSGCIDTLDRALRADRSVARLDLSEGMSVFVVFDGSLPVTRERIEKRCRQTAGEDWRARITELREIGPASRTAFRILVSGLDGGMGIDLVDADSRRGTPIAQSGSSLSALSEPIRGMVGRLLGEPSEPQRRRILEELFQQLDATGSVSADAARLFVVELATMVRLQLPESSAGSADPSAVDLAPVLAAHSVEEIRTAGMGVVGDLATRLHTHAHPDLSWRLSRALDYIAAHLAGDLYIDEVADEVGIGPQHLSRLFKEELDSSFTRYLNERRVEHARFLLLTSAFNVAEVADRVGFRDANYFGKVFRRLTGVTPTQYRAHLREDGS
jgi:two-component system, response regulator YesN